MVVPGVPGDAVIIGEPINRLFRIFVVAVGLRVRGALSRESFAMRVGRRGTGTARSFGARSRGRWGIVIQIAVKSPTTCERNRGGDHNDDLDD